MKFFFSQVMHAASSKRNLSCYKNPEKTKPQKAQTEIKAMHSKEYKKNHKAQSH